MNRAQALIQLDGFKEFSFSNLISWQIEKKKQQHSRAITQLMQSVRFALSEKALSSHESGVHLIDFEVKIDTFHRLEWINFNF